MGISLRCYPFLLVKWVCWLWIHSGIHDFSLIPYHYNNTLMIWTSFFSPLEIFPFFKKYHANFMFPITKSTVFLWKGRGKLFKTVNYGAFHWIFQWKLLRDCRKREIITHAVWIILKARKKRESINWYKFRVIKPVERGIEFRKWKIAEYKLYLYIFLFGII